MKYILHYVGSMNIGGMENVIMTLYRNIDRNKYQFHFAVHGNSKGYYEEEILNLGGKIIRFPEFRKNPYKYNKMWDEFWTENCNKYHAFHYHSNSLANISAIKQAYKNKFTNIIIHAHSSYADKGKLQFIHDHIHNLNKRKILKYSNKLIAVSDKAGEWMFGESNYKIIRNGVDYKKYKFDRNIRKKSRLQMGVVNEVLLGHVGNFLPVKNHLQLLDIFSEFQKIVPNSKLLLFGDGPLREQITNKIESLGLKNDVVLFGKINNIEKYIHALDIFVFPSKYEGLPLAPVEAQVNNLPIVFSSTITDEILIGNSYKKISLSRKNGEWAGNIYELYNSSVRNAEQYYLDFKFDIANTLDELTHLYGSEGK